MLSPSSLFLNFPSGGPFRSTIDRAGGSPDLTSRLELPIDRRRPQPDPDPQSIISTDSLLDYGGISLNYLKKLVPDVFEILKGCGINAKNEAPFPVIHPCTGKLVGHGDDWSNLFEHLLLVGDRTARLFAALKERGLAGEAEITDGARLGCLHDRNRRYQRLEETSRKEAVEAGQAFVSPTIAELVNRGIDSKVAAQLKDRSAENPDGFDNRSGGENIYKFLRVTDQGEVHSVVLDLLLKLKQAQNGSGARALLCEDGNREVLLHSAVVMIDNFMLSCKPGYQIVQSSGIEHHLLDSHTRILGSRQFGWYPLVWSQGYYLNSQNEIRYFRPEEHEGGNLPPESKWLGNIAGLQVALTQQIAELFKFLINPKAPQDAEDLMVGFIRTI